MARLRLCGLPDTLHVGPAALRPRFDLDDLLQACRVCDRYNVNYHLCASGHSICPDCIPPSTTRMKWCVICGAHVDFTGENLTKRAIECLVFSCPCGFTAPLLMIRNHLLKTESPQICFSQNAVGVEHRGEPQPACCARFQELLLDLTREIEELKGCIQRHEIMLSRLTESLSEVNIACRALSPRKRILFFKFNTLEGGESLEQHKVIAGVPLKIRVSAANDEPESLCISVAGSDVNARNSQWPLRKRISIRFLDPECRESSALEIVTFENGNYAHESFVDPASESASPGVQFRVSIANILNLHPGLREGDLILSVRVSELDI